MISKVTSIFKNEDETDASNYRPACLLSNFNGIFEKLLYHGMKDFIDKNELRVCSREDQVGVENVISPISLKLLANP